MEDLAIELVQKIAYETKVLTPGDVVALALSSKKMYSAILGPIGEEDAFDKTQLCALGGPLLCAQRGWWDAVVLAVGRGYRGRVREGDSQPVYVAEVDQEVVHSPFTLACLAGETKVVEVLLAQPGRVDPAGVALSLACASGSTDCVATLLEHPGVDPSWQDYLALVVASECGHAGVVKLLLEDGRVDPTSVAHVLICRVATGDHMDVIRVLLADPRVDPAAQDNFLLRYAAEMGFVELVRLLLGLEGVDPAARDNEAIRLASENAPLDVVRLLLEDGRADPGAQGSYALLQAAWHGRIDLVELLLGWSDRLDLAVGIEAAGRNGREEIVALLCRQ